MIDAAGGWFTPAGGEADLSDVVEAVREHVPVGDRAAALPTGEPDHLIGLSENPIGRRPLAGVDDSVPHSVGSAA